MSTNQKKEWEKEFDEVVRPLGAKGTVCLVPEINQSCEFWMLHQVEPAIKDFITRLLHSRNESLVEKVETLKEETYDDQNPKYVLDKVLEIIRNQE